MIGRRQSRQHHCSDGLDTALPQLRLRLVSAWASPPTARWPAANSAPVKLFLRLRLAIAFPSPRHSVNAWSLRRKLADCRGGEEVMRPCFPVCFSISRTVGVI